MALWDEFSAQFPESYQEGLCEQKWRTFNDGKPDGATFRLYIRKYELNHEDSRELSQKGLLARFVLNYGESVAYLPELNVLAGYDSKNQKWDLVKGEAIVTG